MITVTEQGIRWFIDDKGLIDVLRTQDIPDKGRRGYLTCNYKERRLFIKTFIEKGLIGLARNRILPRAKIEYRIGTFLLSVNIPTPEPVGFGTGVLSSYIIQEYIDGITFADAFRNNLQTRELLLDSLSRLLLALSSNNIRHNDLHLENILLSDGTLYVTDLHKTRIKKSFTVADEVSNIAHALNMIYKDMNEAEKGFFFDSLGKTNIRPEVEATLGQFKTRWITKKMQRSFRDTSVLHRTGNRLYMREAEPIIAHEDTLADVIKTDKKVTVERHNGYIKKIYRDRRRLKKAWRAHVVLAYMRLHITPAAYFVELPGFCKRGAVSMEDLTGKGEELDRYIDRHYDSMNFHERKGLIDRLALFFHGTFQYGIIHHDVKGCNIFVLNGNDFKLLDVEDVGFEKISETSFTRMLIQLNTTLPKRIRNTDRMRFFIRLSGHLVTDKKVIFQRIKKTSSQSEIVYEGVDGLRKETW